MNFWEEIERRNRINQETDLLEFDDGYDIQRI